MVTAINGKFITQALSGVQTYARRYTTYLQYFSYPCEILSPIAKDPLLEINVSKKGLFRGHTWEQISLPYALRKQKTPLLLNLCNTAPVNYKNQIITLHDLAFIHHPQSLSPVFRAYYQWLIPLITRKALAIITISETIADEIQHVYRIPSSRIHIIYNTAEKKQMRPNNRKDFILSVGSIQYRKNYQTIYDAFVRANTGNRWIIVGSTSTIFTKNRKLLDLLRSHPLIEIREHISYEELDRLYAEAGILVTASHYEGCNLPVLEALQSGCPVIASDISAHRELYGDAVQFFNPNDSGMLASLLSNKVTVANTTFPIYTMEEQGPLLIKLLERFSI
ncbi:MAG: glycosyltransferase family 4 protein [Flavobacteriales bacterium]|nr:glycosyltransferase family 4 protein [Flavobacteriales bacterium]